MTSVAETAPTTRRNLSHHGFLLRLFSFAAAGFLVFLVGFLAVRLYTTREAGGRTAASHFELVNSELTNVYLTQALGFADFMAGNDRLAGFGEAAQRLIGEAGLAALILRGPGGVLYAYAPERTLFEPAAGPPQRLHLPSLHTMFAAPFAGDPAATLTASYRLVSREHAFRIVRDGLFLVLAFLLACAIALLLIVTLTPRPLTESPPAPPLPAITGAPAAADVPVMADVPAVDGMPAPDGVPVTAGVPAADSFPAAAPEPAAAAVPSNGGIPVTAGAEIAGRYDGHYGLEPQDQFGHRLRVELERAAAYHTDLSVALGVLLAAEATTGDSSARLADLVRELARLPELAFAYGTAGFALVLPETNLDSAMAQLEPWRRRTAAAGLSIAIGVGDRSGRYLDGDRLLLEVEQALGRAMANGGHNLVAFRADPAKYRVLEGAAGR